MRTTGILLMAGLLPLLLIGGCARMEYAPTIGSESELIPFYVYRHHGKASLAAGEGWKVVPGQNDVVVGFWLRSGEGGWPVRPFKFREEIWIEFDRRTGNVVTGLWDSWYQEFPPRNLPERKERDTNTIVAGTVYMPYDDGGAGWMDLQLAKEWWRTTPEVEVKFRKYTNPSRFPTE